MFFLLLANGSAIQISKFDVCDYNTCNELYFGLTIPSQYVAELQLLAHLSDFQAPKRRTIGIFPSSIIENSQGLS